MIVARIIAVCIIVTLFTLVGCKRNTRNDVWRKYDYLTPVSPDTGINVTPSNRIVPYTQQIYDNDGTYVIPYGSGLCATGSNLHECY